MDTTAKAFFSYAHSDDDREGGRIKRLAKLVREEYETLTGTTIEIFVDSTGIAWGDDFRAKIEEALQETAFFIPVLTPTYFLRDECRREMSQFVRSATSLGLGQLLLSLRYIPVADMTEDSADKLKAVAAKMQYASWEDLRLEEEGSSMHRKAVNALASRLVHLASNLESEDPEAKPAGALGVTIEDSTSTGTANGKAATGAEERPPSSASAQDASLKGESEADKPRPFDDDDDDAPGLLDLVADAQPAMESWTDTLNSLTEVTGRFNSKFTAATDRMNTGSKQANDFARRIVISRELASDVEPELQEIEALSRSYSEGLLRLDSTIRALFSFAELATDGGTVDAAATLRTSISVLVQQSGDAMEGLQSAADSAKENAKMSRDLRPVLRRFETAVRNIIDGYAIIHEWESI